MLVRPRVVSELSGESLLLQDALEPLLQRGDPGVVCIQGAPGSGKSSALRSLAAQLPKGSIVELLDEPDRGRIAELSDRMLVVYAATDPLPLHHKAVYLLAPWGQDEALEYVLGAHPSRCASVLGRIHKAPARRLPDLPHLWTICLDEMAADDSILDWEAALRSYLVRRVSPQLRKRARQLCWRRLRDAPGFDEVQMWGHSGFLGFLLGRGLSSEDVRLLRHPGVRLMLAAERLAGLGEDGIFQVGLGGWLPGDLIRKAGDLVRGRTGELSQLEIYLKHNVLAQPMGVSLLLAAGTGWKPTENSKIKWLKSAHLAGVEWPRAPLSNVQFEHADLARANLSESTLDQAAFASACLRGANLQGCALNFASLKEADASGADLSQVRAEALDGFNAILQGTRFDGALLRRARFMGADLRGATFRRAELKGAIFQGTPRPRTLSPESLEVFKKLKKKGYMPLIEAPKVQARLEGADFTGADLESAQLMGLDLREAVLSGSRFVDALLAGANLEGVQFPGGQFDEAILIEAQLTGSVMPGASFRFANLRGAKLADVDWERADLQGADLTDAVFHMGSSRSGLLFGGPSEGTRSGFYTDEFYDQSYRAPEDIRSANLRGADLRDAQVDGTDFYLVDLREAQYTPEQEAWFRRCGAILETRV